MTPEDIGEQVDLIVSDVSFISLKKSFPPPFLCLKRGGCLVLIKPQFELQPEDIGPGGIVQDPALHRRAVDSIRTFVTDELNRSWMGCEPSPYHGTDGNHKIPGMAQIARLFLSEEILPGTPWTGSTVFLKPVVIP